MSLSLLSISWFLVLLTVVSTSVTAQPTLVPTNAFRSSAGYYGNGTVSSTASSIISSTAESGIHSSTTASSIDTSKTASPSTSSVFNQTTSSAFNQTKEYYYTGYTGSLAQYSSYCSAQYFAWWTASNPGTYTSDRTFYEGFGPTDSRGVPTSITIQSFYPTTYTYTENLPSDFPGHASPPCCSSCTIVASTVDLFYWPPSASATGRPIAGNNSNAIHSSVNEAGFTFVSPSIYIGFRTLNAHDLCGPVGPRLVNTTMGFAPGEISTLMPYLSTDAKTRPPPQMIDVADLTQNCSTVPGYFWMPDNPDNAWAGAKTAKDPCHPLLAVPSRVLSIDPAWASCAFGRLGGFYDPPHPMTGVAALDPATAIGGDPSPTQVLPGPTPEPVTAPATVAPSVTAAPQTGHDPPVGTQDPQDVNGGNPAAPSSNPNPNPNPQPEPQSQPQSQAQPDPQPQSQPQSQPQPQPQSQPEPQSQPQPQPTPSPNGPSPSNPRPSNPSGSQQQGTDPSVLPQPSNQQPESDPAVIPQSEDQHSGNQQHGSQSPSTQGPVNQGSATQGPGSSPTGDPPGSNNQQVPSSAPAVIVQGHTIAENDPVVTIGGKPVVYSSGSIYVGSTAAPAPTPVPAPSPASSRQQQEQQQQQEPSPFPVAGFTFSPMPHSSQGEATVPAVVIQGQPVAENSPAVAIGGTAVAYSASIMVGTHAVAPVPTSGPNQPQQNFNPVTVEGYTFQPVQPTGKGDNAAPAVVVQGHTISEDSPAITVGGNAVGYSAGSVYVGTNAASLPTPTSPPQQRQQQQQQSPSAAVIGGLTFVPVSPAAQTQPAAPVVVAGQTASVNSAGVVVVGGQSIAPGAAAITVGGTPVSLGFTGLVVGSSPVQFPHLPPSPMPPVATVAGQTLTSGVPGIVIIEGSTLTPGAPGITISGTPISIEASALVIGTSTIPLPASPIITSWPPGVVIIGSSTLTAGAPAITVSGTRISLGPTALVVGGSTIPLPASSPTPTSIFTVGSVTFAANPTAFSIAGTTLMQGGKDVTIQGTVVSLGPSGIVVGGSTIPLTMTNTVGGGLGAIILSGLGPINGPTPTAVLTSTILTITSTKATSTRSNSTIATSTSITSVSVASTTSTTTTATAKSTANRSVISISGLAGTLAGCICLGAMAL